MTQETHPISDLDILLSNDNITEDDLFEFPDSIFAEPKPLVFKTPLTNEPISLPFTPTDEPTIARTIDPTNENQLSLQDNFSRNRKRAKKLLLDVALPENHNFNLVYPILFKKIPTNRE